MDTELLYLKIKDISLLINISERNLQRLCQNNKCTCRYSLTSSLGRGGKQYEILVSSLSYEIQQQIYAGLNNRQLDETKTISKSDIVDSTTRGINGSNSNAPFSLEVVKGKSLNNARKMKSTSCIPFSLNENEEQYFVPEKARKIALAKVDLVNHWEAYRNNTNCKAKADEKFIIAYNSNVLCINLHSIIGDISVKSLQRWKKELRNSANDYRVLIPNYNYGCESVINTKLSNEEQKRFLDLMLSPKKFSVGNAYRLISYSLKNEGCENISSLATYKRFADKIKRNRYDIWTLMRGGEKSLNDDVLPYIPRDISKLEVGDVLIADGHVLDFTVINPFTGKPCRATIVVYQDWKSADIAGYEIMMNENTQCVASALRNSIIRLGKIPKIAYQDNGRAFKNEFFKGNVDLTQCGFYGLFGTLGIIPVYTWAYHGQSKPVERFFREFTQTYSSLMPSYVGNNIENKPAYMKRNEKFHKSIHQEYVPTVEETIAALEKWFDFYRSQPCPHVKGKTIGEVFNEGKGSGVDINQLDELMMAQQTRVVRRNGVKMFNNMFFSNELYGVRDTVVVKYSLLNIFKVKIYSLLGEYVCEAEALKELHPMAAYLGDANDITTLNQAIKDKKALVKKTMTDAKALVPRLREQTWQQAVRPKKIKANEVKTIKSTNNYKINFNNVESIETKKTEYKITW